MKKFFVLQLQQKKKSLIKELISEEAGFIKMPEKLLSLEEARIYSKKLIGKWATEK